MSVNCLFFSCRYRARDGPQSGEQAQVHLHHQTQPAAPPLVRSHVALIGKKWQSSLIFIYFAADRHGPNSVARTCECLEGVSSREFAFLTHLLMIRARLFSKLHFVKLQPANQLLKPHPNSKHVRRHGSQSVEPCHLQTGLRLPFLVCFPFPNQKIVAFWRCSPKWNVAVSTKSEKKGSGFSRTSAKLAQESTRRCG